MTNPIKLDTSFNLQNFLSALAIAGGLVTWAMHLESRMSVIEATQKAQSESDKRQDAEKDRLQDQIEVQLQRVEAKLDRLVEQRITGRHP